MKRDTNEKGFQEKIFLCVLLSPPYFRDRICPAFTDNLKIFKAPLSLHAL